MGAYRRIRQRICENADFYGVSHRRGCDACFLGCRDPYLWSDILFYTLPVGNLYGRNELDFALCDAHIPQLPLPHHSRRNTLYLTYCGLGTDVYRHGYLLDPYTAYARMVTEFVMRPLGLESPSVCFGISAFAAAAATALAIVAVAPKRGRLLCNSVCPVGILLGIGSSKAVFHAEIDPDKCINCGLCEQNCKSECIDSKMHTIDYQRCVVCFDCMAVCPNGAISYKTGRNRLSMPMMQSTSASQSQMNSNETIS